MFLFKRPGALHFLQKGKTMNTPTDIYLSILKEKLNLFMTIDVCSRFQQDSPPCYNSERVVAWIKKHFQLLEWAKNSPDLNPIENYGK